MSPALPKRAARARLLPQIQVDRVLRAGHERQVVDVLEPRGPDIAIADEGLQVARAEHLRGAAVLGVDGVHVLEFHAESPVALVVVADTDSQAIAQPHRVVVAVEGHGTNESALHAAIGVLDGVADERDILPHRLTWPAIQGARVHGRRRDSLICRRDIGDILRARWTCSATCGKHEGQEQ